MPKEIKRKKDLIAGIESKLLGIVRESDGISRLALSRKLSLAPSTVGIYVERLLEEGFLMEAKKKKALKSGRPEVHLLVNPERGEFIGIDFFAEHIMAMAVDFGNNQQRESVISVSKNDSAEELERKLIKCIKDVMHSEKELLGIGVSIPGSLDKENGVLIKYKWLPLIENFDVGQILQKNFSVPFSFENTANLMALGEMNCGVDRNLDNFVSVTIRSGIGCGVVIDGKIVAGENNLCGEIEYWKCPSLDSAGKLSELGELVSSSAIMKQVDDSLRDGEYSTLKIGAGIKEILNAYKNNDDLAVKVIRQSIPTLAWALGQMSLALAPKKLLLAGDFTELGDDWFVPLQQGLDEYYENLPMSPPILALSTLGNSCAALGAASMAVLNWRLSR